MPRRKVARKQKMKIGITGKAVNVDNKYHVNWGSSPTTYNKHMKSFKTRKAATNFKNDVAKMYKGIYPIDYMYIAD